MVFKEFMKEQRISFQKIIRLDSKVPTGRKRSERWGIVDVDVMSFRDNIQFEIEFGGALMSDGKLYLDKKMFDEFVTGLQDIQKTLTAEIKL